MLTSLICLLMVYHGIASIICFFAAKVMLCSGHLSIMCALLEREAMSKAVRKSVGKAVRHAGWCAALFIIMCLL